MYERPENPPLYPPSRQGSQEEVPISIEGVPKAQSVMHFFRHARKAGGNDVPHEEDLVMEITPEGWEESFAAGRKIIRIPGAHVLISGGPRIRSRQTALATYAAGHQAVTGNERSIEEIWEALGETPDVPVRIWISPNLDMPFVKGETPGVDRIIAAYNQNRSLLEVLELHKESLERNDPKNSSIFAKEVYGIASMIFREARRMPKFVDNPRVPNSIERFPGTHGTVQESFWVELVRKLKGENEVEKLLSAIPNGVGYNEGMEVHTTAESKDEEAKVRITFSVGKGENRYEFDETVPASTIWEIADEFGPGTLRP